MTFFIPFQTAGSVRLLSKISLYLCLVPVEMLRKKQLELMLTVAWCLIASASISILTIDTNEPIEPSNWKSLTPGSVSDQELAAISQRLHQNDANGAQSIDLNLQSRTSSGNTQDKAPYP